MRFLVTYDLKEDHTKVKDALKKAGWQETISSGITCYLPNTCLWKEGTQTTAYCRDEVCKIAAANSAKGESNLERIICVRFEDWAALRGTAL